MNFSGNRLYKVKSHKVLAKILECNVEELKRISRSPNDFYNVFDIKSNGKSRKVENPKPELKKIHKKMKYIFSDNDLPSYVQSGAKGRSYKANAEKHISNKYIATMDIQKFFPSCSENLVWKYFYNEMKMSADVARTLSKICCYDGHIPTGSPISLLLAYLINAGLFDHINSNAISLGQQFSLYVDDMTFSTSSKKISRTYHLFINKLLQKNGLQLKKSKVIYFNADEEKLITGCKINKENKLVATDKLKKKLFNVIEGNKLDQLGLKEIRSALGRVHSARFVEGKVFSNLKDKLSEKLK